MKKILSVLTLTLLMVMNLTACTLNKESFVQAGIPDPGIKPLGLDVEESMEAVPESDSTTEGAPSIDLSYNGGYEFPEKVTVGHCTECDEAYANTMITDELIPTSDVDTKEFVYLGYHDMIINEHSFYDVQVVASEIDREYMKDYTIDDWEDESVYIKILQITDNGEYYGYLYDKTHPVKYTDGRVEYPQIYTYCPADPITTDDMITALHAFEFTNIPEDDGDEHLHILPVVN